MMVPRHLMACCLPFALAHPPEALPVSDIYAIHVAKTEFREGYNTGDLDRLVAVFSPGGFTDMSEGEPSKYRLEAVATLRSRLAKLFAEYFVNLTPIVNKIVVTGDSAYDCGSTRADNPVVERSSPTSPTTQSCATPVSWRLPKCL